MIVMESHRTNFIAPRTFWSNTFHRLITSVLTCIYSMKAKVLRLCGWEPILGHCCLFAYPVLSRALRLECSVDVDLMPLMPTRVAHGYPHSDGILCFLEPGQLPLLRGITSLILDRTSIELDAALPRSLFINRNQIWILLWHRFWVLLIWILQYEFY